ncbi:MAG: lanthionine synthetase C family protein [Bacteroidia bacterium]
MTEINDLKYKCLLKVKEIEESIALQKIETISLMSGGSGIILFYLYLYKETKKEMYYKRAEHLVLILVDSLNKNKFSMDFATGCSGALWMLKHLSENNFIEIPANFFDEKIISLMKDFSISQIKNRKFDFLYGGLGPILFFIEDGWANESEFNEKILSLLKNNSIENGDGVFWDGSFFCEDENLEVNLGLAHGIPSIIYFLVKLCSENKNKSQHTIFLKKSVDWLLSNKIGNEKSISLFPTVIKNKDKHLNSRLAWCYGDLGIASILWQAGKVMKDDYIKNEAVDIMLHASKRTDLYENQILDAGICHGTAGVAHIFNYFFKETRIATFKEVGDYWISETLKMAKHTNSNVAGYKVWLGESRQWVDEYGLLEGGAGIGLVLLSYISDDTLSWDRCILLN